MKKRFGPVLAVLVLAASIPQDASGNAAGTAGFAFLKFSPFARASAMAEATSAFVGDVMSVYSNPAGLAHMTAREVSAQHVSYFQDTLYDNVAAAFPLRRGGWGASLGALSVRDIPRTRYDAASADRFVEAGEVKAGDQYASFAWGGRQNRNLALGAGIKVAREELDNRSAVALMADLGGIYRVDRAWRVAAVAQNLGASTKFLSETVSTPARLRGGVYYAPEEWMEWEADAVHNLSGDTELLAGGELNWDHTGFLRLGYRYRIRRTGLDSWTGLSAGVGLQLRAFRADYAFLPFGDLGDVHRVSLAWRFAAATAAPAAKNFPR